MIELGRSWKPEFKTIYGLLDPRTEEIFYVGKASDPIWRFYTHLSRAWWNLIGKSEADHPNAGKDTRIRDICSEGQLPALVILGSERDSSERSWIRKLRTEGQPLTNIHHNPIREKRSRLSATTRERMSRSQQARSGEISATMKALWADPAWRAGALERLAAGREKRRKQ